MLCTWLFTITAEIHARTLANFYCQYEIHATRQRARAGNSTICYRKKIDVSFYCVCPVIDDELRHNIVKVVCYFDNVMTKFMVNNRTDA